MGLLDANANTEESGNARKRRARLYLIATWILLISSGLRLFLPASMVHGHFWLRGVMGLFTGFASILYIAAFRGWFDRSPQGVMRQ